MRTLALFFGLVLVTVTGPARGDSPFTARSAPVLLDASEQEIGILLSLLERAGSSIEISPWAIIGIEIDGREFGLELNSEGEFESSCNNWSLLFFEDSSCSGQPYLLANPGCRTEILKFELAAVVGEQGWLPLDPNGEKQWIESFSARTADGTCLMQFGIELLATPAEVVIDLGRFTPPYRLTLRAPKKTPP